MRCGCPQCGSYMIQAESLNLGCVCPNCLYRCSACMGTNTVVSRERLHTLQFDGDAIQSESMDDVESGPLRPEDFID